MNELELGFKDALQNQRLVHGALKRAHIYTTRVDYEDYFQEAMIIYAKTYQQFFQKAGDMDKFHSFIFQKLVWRLLDMLRQEKKYFDFHSLEEFDFQRVPEDLSIDNFDFINLSELTEIDRAILQKHFIEGTPLVILAKRYNHTTRGLRYCRDRLLKKLRYMNEH